MKTLSLNSEIQVAIEKVTCLVYGGEPGNKWEQRQVAMLLLENGCEAIQRQHREYPQSAGGFRALPSVMEFREPTPDEITAAKMVETFNDLTATPVRFEWWQNKISNELGEEVPSE